jgi:hypothetical protein
MSGSHHRNEHGASQEEKKAGQVGMKAKIEARSQPRDESHSKCHPGEDRGHDKFHPV